MTITAEPLDQDYIFSGYAHYGIIAPREHLGKMTSLETVRRILFSSAGRALTWNLMDENGDPSSYEDQLVFAGWIAGNHYQGQVRVIPVKYTVSEGGQTHSFPSIFKANTEHQ